jgi:penicillin-binding protein 2
MRTHSLIKDQNREKRLILARTLVAVAGVFVLMLVVVARMAYLQVLNHQHFSILSHENRVKLVPVPPTRGLIYDRNGVILAENQPSFRLVATPEQVPNMDEALAGLAGIIALSEQEIDEFREELRRRRRFEEVPLKLRLNEDEVARLAVDRHRFPGFEVQAQLTRHYPLGPVAVHAIGYVGRINEQDVTRLEKQNALGNYRGTTHIGKLGIERQYEELLHGQVGSMRVETNAVGRAIRVLERTPPVSGTDIYLTLDIRLQRAAEQALKDFSGAVVAIDPNTGEVLALASNPTYDPNPFVNGISVDDYRALQQNRARPLYNRALRGQYPPASTLKPFIGMAGLDHGTRSPDERIFCRGHYQLPGLDHRYRDWKRSGHGHTDFVDAVAESCDVYFYDLAYNLGIDAMSSFLKQFGFGERTGIDLPSELDGILPSREWKRATRGQPWFHGETVISGIGQGFWLTTPLQLAHATATLANRGRQATPHLLLASGRPEQDAPVAAPVNHELRVRLKNPAHWDAAIKAMREVVHGRRGTARAIGRDLPYDIAGKTGTAQVISIAQDQEYDASKLARELHDHGLFIGFAPADKPRIAVAVITENSGGGAAAPAAREVIDAYLRGEASGAR